MPPVDPRTDPRPDASVLFNPAVVTLPDELRARIRKTRVRGIPVEQVRNAWRRSDWKEMPFFPLIGEYATLVRKADFLEALPHLGTNLVKYSADHNWVCREYGFVFAAMTAAELWVQAGIVCDTEGHHLYSFVPVVQGSQNDVEILIVEPQLDRVVPHTDPQDHYVGKSGVAMLI